MTLTLPHFQPSRQAVRQITKLVKETGTAPMGMDIGPITHMTAAIRAQTVS